MTPKQSPPSEMKDLLYVREDTSNWELAARSWEARAEAAEARCVRLEKALEFYADCMNWSVDGTFTPGSPKSEYRPDCGDTARVALSDTAQEKRDDVSGRAAHYDLGRKDGRDEMRERAAKLVEDWPAIPDKRSIVADAIRNLPIEEGGE